jgi:hypothetical protein
MDVSYNPLGCNYTVEALGYKPSSMCTPLRAFASTPLVVGAVDKYSLAAFPVTVFGWNLWATGGNGLYCMWRYGAPIATSAQPIGIMNNWFPIAATNDYTQAQAAAMNSTANATAGLQITCPPPFSDTFTPTLDSMWWLQIGDSNDVTYGTVTEPLPVYYALGCAPGNLHHLHACV